MHGKKHSAKKEKCLKTRNEANKTALCILNVILWSSRDAVCVYIYIVFMKLLLYVQRKIVKPVRFSLQLFVFEPEEKKTKTKQRIAQCITYGKIEAWDFTPKHWKNGCDDYFRHVFWNESAFVINTFFNCPT